MRFVFLIFISSNISWAAPNFFNYQGRIFDSNGNPSNSGTIDIKIQVLSPTECLLREEEFDVDMEGTKGHFHISIGLGALTASSPSFQFSDLFSPNTAFNDALMDCTGNTYVSGASDHRLIRVFIDDERLDPDLVVNSVPFALNAVESQKLSGKNASEFLQVEGAQLTQSGLKSFFDQAANLSGSQSLRRNPTNDAWEVFTPGVANSGVASVGIGAGLTDSGTASDPVLAADIGVGAGQILGASAVAACAANQKLQWTVATGWSCVADLDTDTTYSDATTSVAGLMSATDKTKLDGVESGATADQTASEILTAILTVDGASSGLDADLLDGQNSSYYLNYNNLTNTPTVGDISSGGNTNGANLIIGTNDAFDFRLESGGTTRMTVDKDGNIGIGDNSPDLNLEVIGDFGVSAAAGGDGNRLIVDSSGNVGIGTTSVTSKLVVDGAVRNLAAISNSGSTIDFADGNLQYTSQNCGSFNLHNLKDGGTYSLAIQGTTAATCSFSAYSDAGSTSLTVHLPSGHGATIDGEHTIYSIMVMGTHAYLSWITEFD